VAEQNQKASSALPNPQLVKGNFMPYSRGLYSELEWPEYITGILLETIYIHICTYVCGLKPTHLAQQRILEYFFAALYVQLHQANVKYEEVEISLCNTRKEL
jgi:hypothetical protein